MMKSSWGAVAGVVMVVAFGLGVAWLADPGARALLGVPMLPALAALAFLIQWVVFVPSYMAQTEHYYDLTGSATYLLLIVIALSAALAEGLHARALLLGIMAAVWALRLGSFLFRRVRQRGKDGRFDEIKASFPRFLVAWTVQGLWVFLTLFAALIVMGQAEPQPLGIVALFGALVWVAGFTIEVVADAQKAAFAAQPENRGRFIQSGLWRWSRHPNYFGEILLWTGVAIIAAPVFQGWEWLGLLSPLFVIVLLTRVSGVPILEERAEAKWGADPEYQRYRDATPVLVPRPPATQASSRK